MYRDGYSTPFRQLTLQKACNKIKFTLRIRIIESHIEILCVDLHAC